MESSRPALPRSRRRYAEWRRSWPRAASLSRLFAVVAEQVAHVLGVPFASVVRFEDEGTVVQRASYAERGVVFPSDKRWPLEGTSALAQVRAHGKPARLEDYSGHRRVRSPSTSAESASARPWPFRSVVAGRLWGAMVVSADRVRAPGRHRGAPDRFHGAARDSDLEFRGAQDEVTPAREGAGRLAARRDACRATTCRPPSSSGRLVARSAGCSAPTWRASLVTTPTTSSRTSPRGALPARLQTYGGARFAGLPRLVQDDSRHRAARAGR